MHTKQCIDQQEMEILKATLDNMPEFSSVGVLNQFSQSQLKSHYSSLYSMPDEPSSAPAQEPKKASETHKCFERLPDIEFILYSL